MSGAGKTVWWLLFAGLGCASDWTWWLNLDSFASIEDETAPDLGKTSLLQRARLNLEGDLGNGFSVEIAYELDGLVRENLGRFPVVFEGPFLRRDDLDTTVHDGEDTLVLQNADRLAVRYERGRGTFVVGRQAVGHGNGRFFNPSDLFAPLSGTSLNAQYKAGIDGVRYTSGFGDDSELGLMAFFPEEGDGVALARMATLIGNLDLSVLAGSSYGEPTLAWDLAGTWLGASLTTEGVWRKGDDRDDPLRMAAGINRRFGEKWDLTLEAHYNSLGDDPDALANTPEGRAGELVWQAETLAATALSVELTPLIRLDSVLIWEGTDDSAWFQSGVTWDVSSLATLNAGALLTRGEPTSELGRFSETIYAEYRLTLP